MPLPRTSPRLLSPPALISLLAITLSALGLAAAPPAMAATGSPLGTPQESAVAVPFIGDFEVWCTDRNPAPGNRCSRHHGSPAIDIGMDPGTPLHAAGSGTVVDADSGCPARGSCNNGMGNNVIISHADGTFSRYLHMAEVSVALDEVVTVGQPIGTSGESGQYSSPHLHYDEHFPFGTRTDMGQWVGCVADEQVLYPDVFGVTDWNLVPYGSRIVNEGFGCLDGVDISSTSQPRVLSGTTHFGITAPTAVARTWYQVSVEQSNESAPVLVAMTGTSLLRLPAPSEPVEVRIRQLVDGQWNDWSNPVAYQPVFGAAAQDAPTCGGLFATTTSLTGTPDADVIIGTSGPDTINARGGDDLICAESGDDNILAGPGKDIVFGGLGNDIISGGKGGDDIRGEGGEDSIRGGDGKDKIHGGADDDTINGTAGNDDLDGGKGNDTVIGGIGHDVLRGAAGNDVVDGRNGRDIILGGNGDDTVLGGNGRDRLVGGAGLDTIRGGPGSDRCVIDTSVDELFEGCER